MRILVATPYFYDRNHKEFTATSSGFGYMVKDILDAVSSQNQVYVFTHQFSNGYFEKFTVVKHTKKTVIKNIRARDVVNGLKDAVKMREDINTALHYLYYQINKGAFIKTLKDFQPDIVHIHGLTYQTRPFIEACREMQQSFIVTLHGLNGIDDAVLLPKIEKEYEKVCLADFAKSDIPVTVVSSGIKKKIWSYYGISNENVTVIINGTTVVPEKYNKKKNEVFNIICVGTVCIRKNQTQLVDCVAKLPDEYKNKIKITFVGKNQGTFNLMNYIKNKSVQQFAEHRGFVPREEMIELWKKADLNVVMSKDEGFGLSMIEGFVNGVPTLTFSDLDAIEDVYNEDSVELFASRLDEDVVLGIINCIDKKFNADRIKSWGKRFSMDSIGKQYSEYYEEINKKIKFK